MNSNKLTLIAFLLLACSLMCSFWCSFSNRQYTKHLEHQVTELEDKTQTQHIVNIESDEYDQIRSFVDIVTKWGDLSTQESDTYINQLNTVIELQKQVDRLTPTKQKMLRYIKTADAPSVDQFIQPYISQGWRVKEIAGSSPVYILLEK